MKIKKILIIILLVILGFSVASYLSIKTEWQDFMTNKEAKELIFDIKSADSLPKPFYKLYEKIYPKSLENGVNMQLLKRAFGKKHVRIPSYLAAFNSKYIYKSFHKKRLISNRLLSLTWMIEKETNQKECLNYFVSKYDFNNNINGIKEAAKYYFNKGLSTLNKEEVASLVLMLDNPYFYNPKTNKERLAKKVKELLSSNEN